MTIVFAAVQSLQEVDELGAALVDPLLDVVSFALDASISNARLTGHNIAPIPGAMTMAHGILTPVVTRATVAQPSRAFSVEEIQQAQAAIDRCEGEANIPLRIYRYALGTNDVVVRFLMLYLILDHICEGHQQTVDALILRIANQTPTSLSPHNGRPETLYTRLRNELTHRASLSPSETESEIQGILDGFKSVVRAAMERPDRE